MNEVFERLKNALVDTYTVEQPLGEGGMAFVFLATDIKHDRSVAIKVLRPDLTASIGAERFLNEIQITARLQHPHILPLYDSGEADGLLYYVMPLVQGETLGEYVAREQQLSIDESIQIAREIAEALGHAHSHGLIHRDIKPDNVMMSGGHAIVADFGIAKAVSMAGGQNLTQSGTAIGTPAYMSPEQAAGDPNVDGRTDIYALGCVLYEMLVGEIPFTGPTSQAIIARHTMDMVSPPSTVRQSVNPDLEDIVFCSMAKSPADRFRTAVEMIDALKAVEIGGRPKVRSTQTRTTVSYVEPKKSPGWKLPALAVGAAVVALAGWQLLSGEFGDASGGIEGGLDPARVAVLYFEDLSPNEDLAHVADGITEGLIEQLRTVRTLDVVSKNAVASFRDPALSRDSVAGVLEAGSMVVGSIEKSGDILRVNITLIDGTSGATAYRDGFQTSATDLLAARDSVVVLVSGFLRERIGSEIRTRELRSSAANPTAWGLVQRAERVRKEAEELEPDEAVVLLNEGDSLLALAEESDPDWVKPPVARAWIGLQLAQFADGADALPWIERSYAHVERALNRNSSDASALEARGAIRFDHWELRVTPDEDEWNQLLTGAEEDLKAAVRADPTLVGARLTLTRLLYHIEDVAGALIYAREAYEEDAYLENADDVLDRLFWGNIDTENLSQAQRWCMEAAGRFRDDYRFTSCQLWLLTTRQVEADVDEAWRIKLLNDSIMDHLFVTTRAELLVAGVLGRAGLLDSARNVLDRAHDRISSEFDPHFELYSVEAYVRTLINDLDGSIDLLKQYVAANPDHDFSEALGTWWWRSVRNHPRYEEITGGR